MAEDHPITCPASNMHQTTKNIGNSRNVKYNTLWTKTATNIENFKSIMSQTNNLASHNSLQKTQIGKVVVWWSENWYAI